MQSSKIEKELRKPGFLVVTLLLLASFTSAAQAQDAGSSTPRFAELPNFHKVNARLYRGAQPRTGGIQKLASLGINTIINLRDDDSHAEAEAAEAQAAEMRYFNIPFRRLGRPTDAQIEEVLSFINAPENGVVFVHCAHGADRTGTVIAIYRISREGWTALDAIKEAEQYGMRFWQRGMKDYISDYYRDRVLRVKPVQDERRGQSSLPVSPRLRLLPSSPMVEIL